jgi:hypothetical protein
MPIINTGRSGTQPSRWLLTFMDGQVTPNTMAHTVSEIQAVGKEVLSSQSVQLVSLGALWEWRVLDGDLS